MKKLKSIRQLLTEYPDAYFDEEGDLFFKKERVVITKSMFHYFGKLTDNVDYYRNFYEPEPRTEAEKPEKKRLYAYRYKGKVFTGNVVCFDHEDYISTQTERAPEFDERFN